MREYGFSQTCIVDFVLIQGLTQNVFKSTFQKIYFI